ncbi:hypothetical protein [Pseudomonas sp. SWRI179]|uniref:hypothetical protein n=1 Tax=Pseudomonas sp. SWRI179 TaxID=2745497 RepID=UPI0016466A05|nr:hypothetical protein [Pseudomonas sp. SWRI179]MBC3386977.1 hypothetical protein [Pseudomonas sp. SWRI179]
MYLFIFKFHLIEDLLNRRQTNKVVAVRGLANRDKWKKPADPKISHAQLPKSSILRTEAFRNPREVPAYLSWVAKPKPL